MFRFKIKNFLIFTGLLAIIGFVFVFKATPVAAASEVPYTEIEIDYTYYNRFWVRTSTIFLKYTDENNKNSGYNFIAKKFTSSTSGALYVGTKNNKLMFFADKIGQGGVFPMKGWGWKVPYYSKKLYSRLGVEVKPGGVYAVYDLANKRYIKIKVLKITDVTPVVAPIVSSPTTSLPAVVIATTSVAQIITPNASTTTNSSSIPVSVTSTVVVAGAPVITSPANNSSVSQGFAVTWNSVENAYYYQLALECSTCSITVDWGVYQTYQTSGANDRTMLLVLPTYGKYRFKVRAVKMDGSSGPWSEYTNIFYNLNNVIRIGVPTSLTYQFDYTTQTVNVSWQNVSDVSKYQFKLDCYSCSDQIGWNVFMDSSVDQATILAADANRTMTKIKILENKDYRFKVRALDDFGNSGDWTTDYLNFTYVKQ